MLLSVKVFAVCEQIANDFSNMSAAASFLFHPIASFISSQGSALEISDRKQIEMLNRAFDIRPHNIQYVQQGPYELLCQFGYFSGKILLYIDFKSAH